MVVISIGYRLERGEKITGDSEKPFSQKEVYRGEVRCIIEKTKGKNPYGFICNHNYHEGGFNKDVFFSFRSIESKHKIKEDDEISFKIATNQEGMIWAIQVRKIIRKGAT